MLLLFRDDMMHLTTLSRIVSLLFGLACFSDNLGGTTVKDQSLDLVGFFMAMGAGGPFGRGLGLAACCCC